MTSSRPWPGRPAIIVTIRRPAGDWSSQILIPRQPLMAHTTAIHGLGATPKRTSAIGGCWIGYSVSAGQGNAVVTSSIPSAASWYGTPSPYSIWPCLLYTSDAADEEDSVDLGGR